MSDKVADWKGWLTQGQFWIFALVFMMVKVVVNVLMTMQPFYLSYVTGFQSTSPIDTPIQISLIPLISYISSTLFSILMYRRMMILMKNRTKPFLLGLIIIAASSLPYFFFSDDKSTNWPIYICSGIQGIGLSI